MVDAEQIKEGILSVLRAKGPSLPVHIATEVKSTILFTSAFLSELVSENKVKMSNMRVGSSPVYFLPGQETRLEKFSEHLKSKEKEAFLLLKEKGFLPDSAQQPAIRVALRGIRDFALPFKTQDNIIWRYFLIPESEYKVEREKPAEIQIKEEVKEPLKETEIIAKSLEISKKPRERRRVVKRAKSQQKEKFFDRVKEFLSGKSMELKDIAGFTKKEIILRVMDNGQEKILVAFNKKKITDTDIIKAHKRAADFKLPYLVLGTGEPLKKTFDLITAMKDLSSVHGLK